MQKFVCFISSLIMGLAVVCLLGSFTGKPKEKGDTIYMFGFSASFSDSLVYFTDVQQIEGLQVEKKTEFLTNGSAYAQQLKSYLEETLGQKNRTCVTFHSTSKKKLEQKYQKLRKKYSAVKTLEVKYLDANDFKYQNAENEIEETEE